MGEVEESGGIKLFGATIRLKSEEGKKGEKGRECERVGKREEKIIQCPRCKSNETKFCYFNNYNVNQPRHFCKTCQRYWTAGGALRNVAVGAGRRKSKPPCHAPPHFADSDHDTKFQIDHIFPPKRLRINLGLLRTLLNVFLSFFFFFFFFFYLFFSLPITPCHSTT
ncbi:hypothetical protein Fmac_008507 [Flemingia macrophylla]|uniref:Dof-type domain-containing protein n=1 Tax=Flemingia macrophylla TaxID=520843 RepID=A0ABD1MXL1_9FABA